MIVHSDMSKHLDSKVIPKATTVKAGCGTEQLKLISTVSIGSSSWTLTTIAQSIPSMESMLMAIVSEVSDCKGGVAAEL